LARGLGDPNGRPILVEGGSASQAWPVGGLLPRGFVDVQATRNPGTGAVEQRPVMALGELLQPREQLRVALRRLDLGDPVVTAYFNGLVLSFQVKDDAPPCLSD
jgi:hypothetical protein